MNTVGTLAGLSGKQLGATTNWLQFLKDIQLARYGQAVKTTTTPNNWWTSLIPSVGISPATGGTGGTNSGTFPTGVWT